MTAAEIIQKYIAFFEKRGHKRIPNTSLVPENDPTTLFTSSGMQPLVPYLLGEPHPAGKRLVNVQNCFRSQDIDEVGDNRHTTFFRMLGNWSLGDYFKNEEIPWLWELLTKEFGLPKEKLYISVFDGDNDNGIIFDRKSYDIWLDVLDKSFGSSQKGRIFSSIEKNWWSRSGLPENMPVGEIGGPDTEVFYRFDEISHDRKCKGDSPVLCECGTYLEVGNSVFMQYKKTENGFEELSQRNIDYGGGVERLMAAIENQPDIFQTNLFAPIIKSIEKATNKPYVGNEKNMRIIADHLTASSFMISDGLVPSNKNQGYILRRLLRRSFDTLIDEFNAKIMYPIIENIVTQYAETNPKLKETFEKIALTITNEIGIYEKVVGEASRFIRSKYKIQGDELKGMLNISADDAFILYTTHGLSPTQIKSLGYAFNDHEFAEKMKSHQNISRAGATKKFAGGLADHSEKTIMGHTATHLMHQAIRDLLGDKVHQSGSNITPERVRFDFNFDRKLTDEEIKKIEDMVNEKIKENLPVHFEIMPLEKAKKLGAIGLFDEKYSDQVKVYFIGDYSKEFCGGPHV
ncbi:MAG: alanine--tRNA ligase, partial [Patescibacteria group bacterium]